MNSNNSISCSSSSNQANLEKDHLQETSSSSERSISSQDDGVLLLASSRPKKRAGRKKFKETRHPIYRGVRRRNNNKWVCELREPSEQKRIWLGTYSTPEMAARAHDVGALALRGSLATLNFADSHWRLEIPLSNDPKELRQAAIKAANALHQNSHNELIGIDYMNYKKINSSEGVNLKYQENIVISGGPSGSDHNLVGIKEMNNNIQNMEMDNTILCCNWGDNNEMLELEGSLSWQDKMAEGLLLSPTPCLGNCFNWDDVDTSEVEVSLWSYSI